LNFGGGATGNIVGMAASLAFRGIRFVEIPTTMTGQTDSILSNKQAVNGRNGKNLFGSYHAPIFIWIDSKYLETEPVWSRRSGLVEFVKNGFISNPKILEYIEAHLDHGNANVPINDLVHEVIQSKLPILRKDPSEKKYALILEYGHTFGHAIEWTVMKRKEFMAHGEAVGIGMKLASELGCELRRITPAERDLHYHMIEQKVGLTTLLPEYIDMGTLIDAMETDNKKTGRELRFVLLDGIGRCANPEGDYLCTVDPRVLRDVVSKFVARENQKRRRSAPTQWVAKGAPSRPPPALS
jgi:3-dehydroquinate synthetase